MKDFLTLQIKNPTRGNVWKQTEKELILTVLEMHQWNITKSSQYLGVTLRTMYNKFDLFGIPRFKGCYFDVLPDEVKE